MTEALGEPVSVIDAPQGGSQFLWEFEADTVRRGKHGSGVDRRVDGMWTPDFHRADEGAESIRVMESDAVRQSSQDPCQVRVTGTGRALHWGNECGSMLYRFSIPRPAPVPPGCHNNEESIVDRPKVFNRARRDFLTIKVMGQPGECASLVLVERDDVDVLQQPFREYFAGFSRYERSDAEELELTGQLEQFRASRQRNLGQCHRDAITPEGGELVFDGSDVDRSHTGGCRVRGREIATLSARVAEGDRKQGIQAFDGGDVGEAQAHIVDFPKESSAGVIRSHLPDWDDLYVVL